MSGWFSQTQLDDAGTQYIMGPEWASATDQNKVNVNNFVGARWSSLPWVPEKEPQLAVGETSIRVLSAQLATAYALHLRDIIRNNNPLIDTDAEAGEQSILSDVPVTVRNMLIGGGYLRIRREQEVIVPPKRPVGFFLGDNALPIDSRFIAGIIHLGNIAGPISEQALTDSLIDLPDVAHPSLIICTAFLTRLYSGIPVINPRLGVVTLQQLHDLPPTPDPTVRTFVSEQYLAIINGFHGNLYLTTHDSRIYITNYPSTNLMSHVDVNLWQLPISR